MDREALQKILLASFQQEAAERLQLLADQLAHWSVAETTAAQVEDLFREVHSLKGAARAVGQQDTEQLCHHWESLLAAARKSPALLSAANVQLCREALQQVRSLSLGQPVAAPQLQQLKLTLEAAASGQQWQLPATPAAEPQAIVTAAIAEPERVKVSNQNLTTLLFLAESALQLRQDASEQQQQLKLLALDLTVVQKRQALCSGVSQQLAALLPGLSGQHKEQLSEVLSYLDWSQGQLSQLQHRTQSLQRNSVRFYRELTQHADNFYSELQALLLVGAAQLFAGLPAMAQDLSHQTGKELNLIIQDNNLQIDKRIIDELRPVLQHLVRNAVDHGIELPAERLAGGKTAAGTLSLLLHQPSADKFELTIADDGRGIDLARLKAETLAKGLLDASQLAALSAEDTLALVFHSGLSTSAAVSAISGRGLGMAIVRDSVERLAGQIRLQSTPAQGLSVRITLPLSLSTFRVVLVRCHDRTVALPLFAVDNCLRLNNAAIQYVENRASLNTGTEVLALWQLHQVLELPAAASAATEYLHFVVLKVRAERFAVAVDAVLGDLDITVKPLGPQLQKVNCVLGATLLGDGQLVPVLDPGALLQKARKLHSGATPGPQPAQHKLLVLIADDSFTSRALLKAIVETAGYAVLTANDGQHAWELLRQHSIALLVSDVEMPKMDGFQLTAKIRHDPALSALPVILVTGLHSAEDRQRGLEAGANAYLSKSGFEQTSLLDNIQRLI